MRAEGVPTALFARAPRAGWAKTRLAPALGVDGAARLYGAFLRDTLERVGLAKELAPSLWAASARDVEPLRRVAPTLGVCVQPEGDLGLRMRAALQAASETGLALVLGTDAPTLPIRVIREAVSALERADVVLGPSADGGYHLLGVRERPFDLRGVRWSSPHALTDTWERARAEGRTVALASPWYDVDTPDDLRLLRVHLRLRPHAAPHTARALGLLEPVDGAAPGRARL